MVELKSIFDLTPTSRVIVEASAGTGKTYTIVGIYVRMLLEKDLNVDEILTVTFTKKATAELRERILERLRDSLNILVNGITTNDNDPFLIQLNNEVDDRTAAVAKLRQAIHNFDDSQVYTIHGFCQKILQEEALVAGTPFEMNVNPADQVTAIAAADFWRVFMHENSSSETGRYLISKLLSMFDSPEKLIGRNGIGPLLSKRYAVSEGETIDDPKAFLQKVIDLKKEMKELWGSNREVILNILRNCDIAHYQTKIDQRIEDLEIFFIDESFSRDLPDKLDYWTGEYLYDETKLKKNGNTVTKHQFFDHCTTYHELASKLKIVETSLLKQAFMDISKRREELSIQTEAKSYDDLLINIRDALIHQNKGEELANKLRKRYPIALVDEFQDTDPIQYEIFNCIYPAGNNSSTLMMIGDPKQAIYAFRGADLHTYFKAKNDGVEQEYTLNNNFRSTASYIEAINTIFKGDRDPFIEKEIGYSVSKAGRPDHNAALFLDGKKQSAMQVKAVNGVESNKDRLRDDILVRTAHKIAEILELAGQGKAFIGETPLKAGNITVLITRHKDAAFLQQKLKQYGVDSVTKTDQSIFETLEVSRLQMVMNAVLNPINQGVVNASLLTGIFGLELDQLHELKEDEEQRQALMDELTELRDTWHQKGFYAMFYKLMHRKNRLLNLAALDGAERIITNLNHAADLCAKAEQEDGLSPRLLHTWLLRQMAGAEQGDEYELQLESDQHLVKIMTIHSSKGLQFPLVFCPTLWVGKAPETFSKKANGPVEYHNENDSELTINIDRDKTEQRIEAEFQAGLESIAEEVRKTYVALTRAQYGCYIYWGTHTESHFSGLGSSIIGRERVIESINNKSKIRESSELNHNTFLSWFRERETDSGRIVELEVLDEKKPQNFRVESLISVDESFEASRYSGRSSLPVKWQMESFSSLAGHSSDPGEPDHDQVIERYTEAFFSEPIPTKFSDRILFQFPRGATAGTAIHKLFEHEEFEFSMIQKTDFQDHIREIMDQYHFDPRWVDVLQTMMKNVAGASIPGLKLDNLSRKHELREMEFNFSASGVDSDSLLDLIRNGKDYSTNNVKSKQVSMTGFIDLIARQNGRYYILDYKSNYLGNSPDDYNPDKLQKEMAANSYDLQYHLYTIALVKYLRTRLKDFDYDKHFGGAVYLFVRGIKAGSANGIWFHKPEKKTIQKLEELLSRKGSTVY